MKKFLLLLFISIAGDLYQVPVSHAQTPEWTFLKGYGYLPYLGYRGTEKVADEMNNPGSLAGAVKWQKESKLYLFGGFNGEEGNDQPLYNDLWEFDLETNNWRRLKSSTTEEKYGVYGSRGIAKAENIPGARKNAVSWQVGSKLYLFGGEGFSAADNGSLNDLWEFDLTTHNWRWLKGSNVAYQNGIYGTKGLGAVNNTPQANKKGIGWVSSGKLYLFGGISDVNSFLEGETKEELWEYDPETNNWRWLKGLVYPSRVAPNVQYGTLGVAAPGNSPGGRFDAASWEKGGKLYLMGGRVQNNLYSYDSDLWEFDLATNNWRWIKGQNSSGQLPIYGTKGVPDAANTPGGRSRSVSWQSGGKFYLYAGSTFGLTNPGNRSLNDLWEYNPETNNWLWLNGSKSSDQRTVYGIQGVADVQNTPGVKLGLSWEREGKLYLYSSNEGIPDINGNSSKNDLWEYDLTSNMWRWIKGSFFSQQPIIFGTQRVAEPTNIPGKREASAGWESGGKFYLFGGHNFEFTQGSHNYFSDLWEHDLATNNWRWIKGSNIPNQVGIYGSLGEANTENNPGGRYHAASWKKDGKFYLFGGFGYGLQPQLDNIPLLNDLWEYDIATNNWRWLKGSMTVNQPSVYGTQGVGTTSTTPGARYGAASWQVNDKLYLFGGYARGNSDSGYYNDLWEYDLATNKWRWIKGSTNKNPPGLYGSQGIADAANSPGGRGFSASWSYEGKLYLFGGFKAAIGSNPVELNDVWEYDPATNNWRWLKGGKEIDQDGTYGTLGIPDVNNTPGSRFGVSNWQLDGKFYLFGGLNYNNSQSGSRIFNDLWEYNHDTNNWRWLKGSNIPNQAGSYSLQGMPDINNNPGARSSAINWQADGNFYLYGGTGYGINGDYDYRGDLWVLHNVLTPSPIPPPVVTGGVNCGPGSVPLFASGAPSGATYQWYTTLTGNSAIPGATNSTYTTPNLAGTTTYYVSIKNGTLESDRKAVTATINPIPVPPVVSSTPILYCVGGSVSALTASGKGLKWYSTATGGNASVTAPIPTTTTAGTFNFYVTQTVLGCESTRSQITVTVSTVPAVTYAPLVNNTVCSNVADFTLTGGLPLGGIYSGTGVNNGVFNATIAGPGSHNITYTYSINGCSESATQSINVSTCTSIEEIKELAKGLVVSPNPTKDKINIRLPLSLKTDITIRLINIKGQVILNRFYGMHRENFNTILDISDQAKGLYLLQIITNKSIMSKKIILN